MRFSGKYEPLFNLLNGDNPEVEIVLISGGRDSSKTFSSGCFIAEAAGRFNHRVLYTRYTMSSTNNSITRALDNRLELTCNASKFSFANNDYIHKSNKGLISITGQKTSSGDQTAKLKSLEGYSMFVTEEAEEMKSYDEWEKIKRSIRANDVRCLSLIIFNPPTKAHWLYEEFYQGVPEGFNGIIGNVMYIHTDYRDNGKDNMALQNWNEYESLRLIYEDYISLTKEQQLLVDKKTLKKVKNYKNTIAGSFRDTAEGVIFEYELGDFYESEYGAVYGMDQGFTHPSALIKVFVDKNHKKIYLKEIYYEVGKTSSQIYEAIKDEVGYTRIWCDSAAAMFIKELWDKQLNIKGCKKQKIKDRINSALDYDIIIDKNSLNLQHEMDNYKWSDKTENTPIDDNNHAIDAWMYAFTHLVTQSIAQPL